MVCRIMAPKMFLSGPRICAHVTAHRRGDLAGRIKLRPLRRDNPGFPGGPVPSQGPFRREVGGSEAERVGRCWVAGCDERRGREPRTWASLEAGNGGS